MRGGGVTLHVRVWIEICLYFKIRHIILVTLHVRVWIEITVHGGGTEIRLSHPPREGVD